jgi:hypothetical protein
MEDHFVAAERVVSAGVAIRAGELPVVSGTARVVEDDVLVELVKFHG